MLTVSRFLRLPSLHRFGEPKLRRTSRERSRRTPSIFLQRTRRTAIPRFRLREQTVHLGQSAARF